MQTNKEKRTENKNTIFQANLNSPNQTNARLGLNSFCWAVENCDIGDGVSGWTSSHFIYSNETTDKDKVLRSEVFNLQKCFEPFLISDYQIYRNEHDKEDKWLGTSAKNYITNDILLNKRKAKEARKLQERMELKFDTSEVEWIKRINKNKSRNWDRFNSEWNPCLSKEGSYIYLKSQTNDPYLKCILSKNHNIFEDKIANKRHRHDYLCSSNVKFSENLNMHNKKESLGKNVNNHEFFKENDYDRVIISLNISQFNSEYFRNFIELIKSVSQNKLSSNFFQKLDNLLKQKHTESSKTVIKINNEPVFPLKTTIEYLCKIYEGTSIKVKKIRECNGYTKNHSIEIFIPKIMY